MTSPSSSERQESPERRLLREAVEDGIDDYWVTTTEGKRWEANVRAFLATPERQDNAAGQEACLPQTTDSARKVGESALPSDGTQTAPVPAAPSEKDELLVDVLRKQVAMLKVELGEAWRFCHQEQERAEKAEALVSATPRILGIDPGLPGGDFTGYACSCGQVRTSRDGPCELVRCPIRATDK